MPRVLVSGCFDLLHPGHIAFLSEAARLGELHVAVGSDANVEQLKGALPTFAQDERVYMLRSLACVADAFVAGGRGMVDFAPDLERLRPDVFVVNEDGHTAEKEALCRARGVEYRVLPRTPPDGMPARSSTAVKRALELPYRLCIAGGWMDQPWISERAPGSLVVAALEPGPFRERCGMATSTRRTALALWGGRVPVNDLERNARLLFAAENPPGTRYVSGSQDAIGLVHPGVNRLRYAGAFWPERIDSTIDPAHAAWLERVLHLVPCTPRPQDYDPLVERNLDAGWIARLGAAGDLAWDSILRHDTAGLGRALDETLAAWRAILPRTVDDALLAQRAALGGHAGSCFSGCGGGYLMVVAEEPVAGAVRFKVRLPAV
jgi:cytidyltransferase-like protein